MICTETVKNGYTFNLLRGGADILCLIPATKEEAEKIFSYLPEPRPSILSFVGYQWYAHLSPWQAKGAFRGSPDFGGLADKLLTEIEDLLPLLEKEFFLSPKSRVIAGYSLAGLFSVYSLFRTEVFEGAVSASGSLWFDGFTEFMEKTPLKGHPKAVYLSVGDKEKITRNQRLGTVEEKTIKAAEVLKSKGVDTVFELNEGNHFAEAEKKVGKRDICSNE